MHRISTVICATLVAASHAVAQNTPQQAPCTTAEFRQLDFWVGDWELEFTKPDGTIGKASNRIVKDEYGSCVISEHFSMPGRPGGGDYIGGSHSIYDAQTKSWRQVWVDNGGGYFDLRGGPVTGQAHVFELVNVEPRGPKKATMRMIWQDVTPQSLTWKWQSQEADGSWKDQWVLRYRRKT